MMPSLYPTYVQQTPGSTSPSPCQTVAPMPPRTSKPTKAVVNALRSENKRLVCLIQRLKNASTPEELWVALHSGEDETSSTHQQGATIPLASSNTESVALNKEEINEQTEESEFVELVSPQMTFDASSYISVDESGNFNSFGPSSAWQMITDAPAIVQKIATENTKNALVANAALSRQSEYRLATFGELAGVPIDLATHLLELHWNRQHHTFLLTYRPAIIHSLLEGGEFGSSFLLNSIFACASKFSTRAELRDSFGSAQEAGAEFFRSCDELMSKENLLLRPSLATIVGLLLLGSTYVARGVTTKGWLLTGYALRMIYDLGLHIDRKSSDDDNVIEEEARRRIFWGAFICDKLQSLYLGRPFAIKLRDAHVSLELKDIMEENELWTPYEDLANQTMNDKNVSRSKFPIYSVSCFQRFCLLSKIMTRIIDEFYVVGATVESAQSSLRSIDNLLQQWEQNLPEGLRIDATSRCGPAVSNAPNVLCLHVIYHALRILLHRPLVADGHLRSASPPAVSWKRCSEAAEKITQIVALYRQLYTLRGAPYLISYGLYVACTIHVRNMGVNTSEMIDKNYSTLERSVRWLEELAVPNPAVAKTVSIIKKLMSARGVRLDFYPDTVGIAVQEELANTEENHGCSTDSAALARDTGSLMDPYFFTNEWDESFSGDLLYGFLEQESFEGMIP
ncbi:unnamed protein product [Penicillium pancosmium]